MESYSGFRFVFSDGEVGELVEMSQIAGERVSVNLERKMLSLTWVMKNMNTTYIRQPFPLKGVGMSSTNIFALKMLKLGMDVVAIAWKFINRM